MPVRPRSRSTSRHTVPPPATHSLQHLGAGPRAAGERHDTDAEGLPVGDEPLVERLRLEPLGDRHERAAQPVDQPDRGGVPVAAVRQGEHDRPPVRADAVDLLLAGGDGVPDDPSGLDHRQPEGLLPVAGVGPHRPPGEGVQLRLAQPAAGDDPQVRAQLAHATAVPPGRPAAGDVERRPGRRLRQELHRAPPDGEPGVGEPRGQPGPRPGARLEKRRSGGGVAHAAGGAAGPRPARRTARKRWPTVTALPTSRIHSATCRA